MFQNFAYIIRFYLFYPIVSQLHCITIIQTTPAVKATTTTTTRRRKTITTTNNKNCCIFLLQQQHQKTEVSRQIDKNICTSNQNCQRSNTNVRDFVAGGYKNKELTREIFFFSLRVEPRVHSIHSLNETVLFSFQFHLTVFLPFHISLCI